MTAPAVFLTQHYADAVQYAATIHANQTRKGNDIPYITHPLAVSSLVLEAGGDEEQAIAGLLHDAAEDCGGEGRLTDIKARFGARVEGIVRGCSDSLTEDPNKKAPWRTRKREHLAHLRVADDDTLLVSAADKLHNARALWTDLQLEGIDTLTRFNARPPNIQWFYEQMLAIFIAKAAPEVLTLPLS